MKKQFILLVALFGLSFSSYANIVGTNIQNFNPVTDGIDFATVHSPETLKPGYFNFGFFLNLAGNSLPSFENDDGEKLNANDRLLYADLNIGFGIMKNVDFGLSFPVILDQQIDEDTQNVLFAENGITEIRANIKYLFTKIRDWKGAFILSINHNLIGNNPYAGENPGNTINTEFTFGRKIQEYNFALNVGYRFRNSGKEIDDSIIQPLEDQWIGSAAISKSLEGSDLKLIFELLGSIPTEVNGNTSTEELSSYEALFGVKYDNSRSVASHAGFGLGLVEDTASPDWRIYTGVNWSFGPIWKKSAKVKSFKAVKTKKYRIKKYRLENLNFKTNSDRFNKKLGTRLVKFLSFLKRKSGKIRRIVVEGHTDSIGDAFFNKDLSRRRAEELKRLIMKYSNVSAEIIKTRGKGESQPIADNGNFQGRAENRRVEVYIYE